MFCFSQLWGLRSPPKLAGKEIGDGAVFHAEHRTARAVEVEAPWRAKRNAPPVIDGTGSSMPATAK
jgi:hypothetical protein